MTTEAHMRRPRIARHDMPPPTRVRPREEHAGVAIGLNAAIVAVEAVKYKMAEGLSPLEATETAMDEVSRPITGVDCALLSVYVPVVFLGGIVGQLYRQFALTLCFAAVLSIL
ncbi:MAG: efflux RND transporter permease subunit, partial [Rubrivivax sp.]|nr:efflux RND transporter permease subunit [Rubrivivax sp.]